MKRRINCILSTEDTFSVKSGQNVHSAFSAMYMVEDT